MIVTGCVNRGHWVSYFTRGVNASKSDVGGCGDISSSSVR